MLPLFAGNVNLTVNILKKWDDKSVTGKYWGVLYDKTLDEYLKIRYLLWTVPKEGGISNGDAQDKANLYKHTQ